ncbi:glycosyltransferase family 2 protein [Diaminobutyricimonas sp. TR449]|uniref:glycosyltransferase family 2 protein n=1 Tax=Diaminobutyricimonas sp. TR449 TaxID=2708076 RepID=UPI0014240E95|nr:glycosyltransferase family 2 protein [Diaminobutyricimonas sp. TR449]
MTAADRQGDGKFGSEVACITVSYYSAADIVELVGSLRESSVALGSIIVVNNAVDDRLDEVRELDGVSIVEAGRNAGYGAAVNIGAASLPPSIEWILVANPDVKVEPTTLSTLLAAAEAAPAAGALGPTLTDEDGAIYPSARELPSLRTGIGHALFANPFPGNRWTRRYRGEDRPATATTRESGWLSGAFLLIRRQAFEQIGGFDPSYFMYFEDVDLGRRLGEAGWVSLYVKDAVVVHHGASSTQRVAAAMNRAHHQSAYQYLARRYSATWLWPLRATLRIALAARERFTRHRNRTG